MLRTGKGLYGVGYNSGGEYKTRDSSSELSDSRTKAYIVWRSILMRCYSKKHHTTHVTGKTYEGCFVCEEWKDYQVFAKWFYENYKEGWEVDKDILFEGNKEYSPDKCRFVPAALNSTYTSSSKNDGLPKGVYKSGRAFLIPGKLAKRYGVTNRFETAEIAEKKYVELTCQRVSDILAEFPDISEDVSISVRIRFGL